MQVAVEELFERFRRRGDVAALAQVFDRTAPEIWRVGRHLCGNRSEADDLLQATFLAAMESAGRWRRGEALVPWLLGILANKLRMARRRDRRALPAEARGVVTAEDPVSAAERGELRELLQQRVAELPELYRSVLVLQLDHGLTAAEVAHALGRPRATVRSQLHRGLELLRRALPLGLLAVPGCTEAPPDLRPVRGVVLAAAGHVATASAVGVGVAVMSKKLLVVPAMALLAAAFWAWPSSHAAPPPPADAAGDTAVIAPVVPAVASVPRVEQAQRSDVSLPAAEATPPVLRVKVTWSDGGPAVAMQVCMQPTSGDASYSQRAADWFRQRFATADTLGIATFRGVEPGKVQVRARHGGNVEVEIAAGRTTEVELLVPEGIDARGRVLGPDGQVVAGAVIAIGTRTQDVLEVARSDGNGAFFLRALSGKTLIAAYADGFAGSQVRMADEFAGGPQDLNLVGTGGSVAGRVLDADGRALPGAWVAHGYVPDIQPGGPRLFAMRSALTDAEGGFRLEGVPLGQPWPLHAGADGHASWNGPIRVGPSEATWIEIRLPRAVVLSGVVRGPGGEPMRGFVSVIDGNSPPQGIGDQRPGWSLTSLSTKDDGAYTFTNLVAGTLVVSARDRSGKVAGRTFTAAAGERLSWDPVLSGELAIRGTLLDDGGSALGGFSLVARAPHGLPEPKQVTSAADGTFTLTGCVGVPHTLLCVMKGNWHQPVLQQRDVVPGGEAIVLRVPRAAMPSCYVTGKLAMGQPAGELSVVMVGERSGLQMAGPLQPGEPFQLGPVPPGRYALQLQGVFERSLKSLLGVGECELQAGQRHDLGDIGLPAPGELTLELTGPGGAPVAQAELMLAMAGAPMGGITLKVAAGRVTQQLSPGSYLPCLCSEGRHVEHPPITVQSGQRTEVRLQLANAVMRRVHYDLSDVGVPLRATATWKKDGTALQRTWFSFWQEGRSSAHDHRFTPGSWELELELGTGAVQRFPFLVSADESGPDITIRIAK